MQPSCLYILQPKSMDVYYQRYIQAITNSIFCQVFFGNNFHVSEALDGKLFNGMALLYLYQWDSTVAHAIPRLPLKIYFCFSIAEEPLKVVSFCTFLCWSSRRMYRAKEWTIFVQMDLCIGDTCSQGNWSSKAFHRGHTAAVPQL